MPKPVFRIDLTLLTVILCILKLSNTIDWSWWVVLAPLWLPTSFILFVMTMAFTIAMIGTALGMPITRNRRK